MNLVSWFFVEPLALRHNGNSLIEENKHKQSYHIKKIPLKKGGISNFHIEFGKPMLL